MLAREPLPLNHSWPHWEADTRFDGGQIDGPMLPISSEAPNRWACDLRDDTITWGNGVFALFGLPRDVAITRRDTLARYEDESRATMERLREHAIRHARGFTIDLRISPIGAAGRWMRLMAAPVLYEGRVIALHGLKHDVTALYRPRHRHRHRRRIAAQ